MKTLQDFLHDVDDHIQEHGFDDVLDLVPFFEDLQIPEYREMLDKQNGEPVTTTIYQSEKIRILIIHWEKGKESSIHGHAGGGGLVKVLEGKLEETRFDPVDQSVLGNYTCTPGMVTYIHDMLALHQVRNAGNGPAFSLHMYTQPQN